MSSPWLTVSERARAAAPPFASCPEARILIAPRSPGQSILAEIRGNCRENSETSKQGVSFDKTSTCRTSSVRPARQARSALLGRHDLVRFVCGQRLKASAQDVEGLGGDEQ